MDLANLFTISTLAIVPAWLLLLVAPRWRGTMFLVQTLPVFGLYALAYWVLRIVRPDLPPGAGLHSLDAFMIALSDPWSALVTWLHILVVDLFVGAWMVRDATRRGIRQVWVAPCLLVTFMAAPLGLLFYGTLRWAMRRTLTLDDAAADPLCGTPGPALPSAP